MNRNRILLVEDEPSIRLALEDDFAFEGYEVESRSSGIDGLQTARERRHDLIILDVMLPGQNGLEVCKALREEGIDTPIIMLTAKSQEIDKVRGLEYGADDYITKPFSSRELHARVRAVLRRYTAIRREVADQPQVFEYQELFVDLKSHEVTYANNSLLLTPIEFSLLSLFVRNVNIALSRDRILDEVWGDDVNVTPRTVDTHVANLRKKIEPADGAKYIHGIRGVGYKFKPI